MTSSLHVQEDHGGCYGTLRSECESPEFNVEHTVDHEAAFQEASLPLVKVAWQGLGKVRVAHGGDGSRLVSPHVVLLFEGLEASGSGPVGLRKPCTVECPMGMGLESISE